MTIFQLALGWGTVHMASMYIYTGTQAWYLLQLLSEPVIPIESPTKRKTMEPAEALKHSISCFAFPPAQRSNPLRRSSRKCVSLKDEIEFQSPAIQPSKREDPKDDSDSDLGSPKKRRRILKRGYAHPETYAHLNMLKDHLAPSLDGNAVHITSQVLSETTHLRVVLFCGIKWETSAGFIISTYPDLVLAACQPLGATTLQTLRTIFGKVFIYLVRFLI
jgi:hypothetical protein